MALVKPSLRFHLSSADVKQWGHNALVFAGPALLVLLASVGQVVPTEWKYGAFVLYLLNVATDLLKKFLAGK